ncbi:MAG TPA: DUF1206 domain-containing protein [Acidimicrobiales bacterium]|nr:DUF1206 domain-containing protein [Acidimicrobiales bacterium]
MTDSAPTARNRPKSAAQDRPKSAGRDRSKSAENGLSVAGRIGLAGRTGFYLILTALIVRIALLGGAKHQVDAQGALSLVGRPLLGKLAIGAVAAGFVLFGVGRLVGAWKDDDEATSKRILTVVQGLFYLFLASVPAGFLAGNTSAGSQQQQQKDTAEVLALPGGRIILVILGLVAMGVCVQQIRGAINRDFKDGLRLRRAPHWVRRTVDGAGVVGITSRALVFFPIGVFLIIAAIKANPNRSYGTDKELLALSGHVWGSVILAVIAAGLAVFVVYSGIETRYRVVLSAR